MMNRKIKTGRVGPRLGSVLLTAALGTAVLGAPHLAAAPGAAQAAIEISAIKVTEIEGNTEVRINASRRPTFTTWKLEQPTRVVVDLSGARVGEVEVPFDAGTYALGAITANSTQDEGGSRTRIVLTLRRPADYRIEAAGNEIVVRVLPYAKPPAPSMEALASTREKARAAEESMRGAVRDADSARKKAEDAQRNAEVARASAEAEARHLSSERAKADEARRLADEARKAAETTAQRLGAEKARTAEERQAAAVEARRLDAERARAEVTRQVAEVAQKNAEATARKLDVDRSAAENSTRIAVAARESAEVARRKAGDEKAHLDEARRQAEAARGAAEAAVLKLAAERASTEAHRTLAIKAKAEADLAAQKLADERAAWDRRRKLDGDSDARKLADETARLEESRRRSDAARQAAEAAAHKLADERSDTERLRANALDAERRARSEREKADAALKLAVDGQKVAAERLRTASQIESERLKTELESARRETEKARAVASQAAAEVLRSENSKRELAELRSQLEARATALARAESEIKRTRSDAEDARRRAEAAERQAESARLREEERGNAVRDAAAQVEARRATVEAKVAAQEQQRRKLEDAERLVAMREVALKAAATDAEARLRAAQEAASRKTALDRAGASEEIRATAAKEAEATARRRAEAVAAADKSRKDLQDAVAARRREDERKTLAEQERAEEERRWKLATQKRAEEDARRLTAEAARRGEEQRLVELKASRDKLELERAKLESDRAKLVSDRGALAAELRKLNDQVRLAQAVPVPAQPAVATKAANQKRDEDEARRLSAEAARRSEERRLVELKASRDKLELERAKLESDRAKLVSDRGALAAELRKLNDQVRLAQTASVPAQPTVALKAPARPPAATSSAPPATGRILAAAALLAPTRPPTAAPALAPMTPAPLATRAPVSITLRVPSLVQRIDFVDEPARSTVIIDLDEPSLFAVEKSGGRRLTLRLLHADLPRGLERSLDATEYLGPVKVISSYRDPAMRGAVRVDVDLAEDVPSHVRQDGTRLYWDFDKRGPKVNMGSLPVPGTVHARARSLDFRHVFVRAPIVAAFHAGPLALLQAQTLGSSPAASEPSAARPNMSRKRYTGRRIDLDFKGADIHNILRLLSDVGGVNIVTSDDVKGEVTIKMKDVPWDQALDVVLRAKLLGSVREGNLFRVAPLSVLEKELEQEIARQKQITDVLPTETRLIGVSYAEAKSLSDRARGLLSQRGKIEVDERTNNLIITDVARNLSLIEELVRNLDTQTSQVVIEARIVEARTTFIRQIGIQWGGSGFADAAHGNPTGIVFPYNVGVGGGATDSTTPTAGLVPAPRSGTGTANPNFAVNLPVAAGLGSGGALGLTLGSVAGAFNLNLRLSALESAGQVRILSSPRISTMDNVEATIEQGVAIPISVVSAQGVQTIFVDAKLNLTVRPHVTAEGTVIMKIQVTRNEPDFVNTGARGDPTILKKEAKTEMLVRDGDTAVIGGIYQRNSGLNNSKVPFFADIPVIGALFRNRRENDDRTEFLVFITPRIANRARALGQ